MIRTNNQKTEEFKQAYSLYDLEEMRELVHPTDIANVIGLRPPSLCFHPDKHKRRDDWITMQLTEAQTCCSFDTSSNIIAERFVQLPTPKLRTIFFDSTKPLVTPEIEEFFSNFKDVFGNYTWPIIRSYLLSLDVDYFNQKLRQAPRDAFVTHFLNQRLWGPHLVGFEDAVKIPPRATEIIELAKELRPLLSSKAAAIANTDKIVTIIQKIDNSSGIYKSYKGTSDEEQAFKTKELLERRAASSKTSTYNMVEACAYDLVLKHYEEWSEDFFQLDQTIEVVDRDRDLLVCRLVPWTSGHKSIIPSKAYFNAMAPSRSNEHRLGAIDSLFTMKRLLAELSIAADIDEFRGWLLSCAMALGSIGGGLEGSALEGCLSHLPAGYWLCAPEGIRIASDHIGAGIGYCEALLLHYALGKEMFDRLLNVFGINAGPQVATPMDLSHQCQGVPAVRGMEARLCTADPNGASSIISLVGADTPGHPFAGNYA